MQKPARVNPARINIVTALTDAQCLVIKIGSSLLVNKGALNRDWIRSLGDDIKVATATGQKIILVCSGAVALGCTRLGLKLAPTDSKLTLEETQAAAAVGQIELAHGWQEILDPLDLRVAQILLTWDDTEQRRRYLNARNTLQTLLRLGTIPIINENDTVATQELRYGDNDRLAARVASMISADCLLVLSDIDGLYRNAPFATENHIAEVDEITPEILAMAKTTSNRFGKGGMVTKLEAAAIAGAAGCHMVLANGDRRHPFSALRTPSPNAPPKATLFRAPMSARIARKDWISGHLQVVGRLSIDAGARAALNNGKSLLPIGVTHISGNFERGDCVIIEYSDTPNNTRGQEIARGLTAYSSDDAARIIGRKSEDIEARLGFCGRAEIVHRDDLVMRAHGKEHEE